MAFRRQVKNFVKNYSDAEMKVREATSNDPWGPSSSLMLEISDLTFNTISLSEIMNMLWQRLSDHGKNWRHVYKSLTLMDYLIKNGSKKVIQHCREGFFNLQMLKDFQHIDEAGKDQGYYIREKSKQVITLLMDEQLLYKEREVTCRTRRCTSYSMTLPKRLPGTGNSPTACASAPTPEIPASEKKHKFLKVSRLHNKENTSKGRLKQEQYQEFQLPAETMLSQETLPPLEGNAWKSTDDLILFSDEDPKPSLPVAPPSVTSPTTCSSDGKVEASNLGDAVNPVKEIVISKDHQKPTQASIVQMDNEDLKTLTTWVSTASASEGTSSFSAASVSPSDAAPSEKPVLHVPPALPRPSLWALPHPRRSAASTKRRGKTAGAHYPFAPRALSSDEEEEDNLSPLEILPDNSDSAKNKTSRISSSDWVAFPTQNVDSMPSVSCSSFQPTQGNLPREPEANSSIKVLLEEVKSAIVRLHEDLSTVIQELNIISSHLVSMSGTSLQVGKSV
ncbi:ENTH domain-containing protein 1 isoform X4 [Fukomys damarensis]|uniref:ENTH domain-containing protein 1 isoform X4 n=1 Tax=Fukomys damarensis TaxID=885580 RepID=UPI00053F7534|nr:ENTH domain-containing protein 1 isoform X4 [Fukomys damarensis]